MANIKYARPSDNVAADATVTVQSGTEDTDYPAANLADLSPEKPAKLTTTTGAWVFDFGSAQSLDAVALIHHNLTAGLEVRVQAHASSSWGSPSLNQTITIPASAGDGFPVNPWLDLTGVSPRSYRYWRIVVVGTNAASVAIGEIVLAETLRELVVNVSWGAGRSLAHPIVEHRTDLGVSSIYDYGTRWHGLTGEVDTTDAGAEALLALAQDARGRARPWLMLPDPDVNEAWLVRFVETGQTRQFVTVDRQVVPFAVEEVSAGLPL